MDIPLKIFISKRLSAIYGFRFVRFQDKFLTDPKLHWYVLIRVPEERCFLVIMITSQINKQIAFYQSTRKPKAADCLVRIDNNIFSRLNKPSIIECNKTEYLNIDEIVHKVEEAKGFVIYNETIPTYLRKEIVSAISSSPLISRFISDKAKVANPI